MKNIIGLILFCMLNSCTEAIDFDPYAQQKVVVNCLLTPDAIQHLTLSYSSKLNQFQYESIVDAKITLFTETESVGTFEPDKYNDWYLPYTPIAGQSYRLLVEIASHPDIEAGTTMPWPITIKKDKENAESNIYIRKYFVLYNV